jgi:hypothetical protein
MSDVNEGIYSQLKIARFLQPENSNLELSNCQTVGDVLDAAAQAMDKHEACEILGPTLFSARTGTPTGYIWKRLYGS